MRHLATGGMAEVLLARVDGIEGFERHVVIKKIRDEQARDARFVQMFLDEARLAAALHHHNIVHVHDIGQDHGEYFFAMEYVHGEDLRKVLAHMAELDRQVPLEHCLTIALATAAALHHAHEHRGPDRKLAGIVHRDVSPANILIGYDGNVKVVDFGIAKVAQRSDETGLMKGKVAYMSPEQCVGGEVDRRSDIFCLGIVLYELMTVRRLFKGANDYLTMSSITHGVIPKPSGFRPEIPAELEAIVLKALAAKPADRYQTADELRAALEQFAARARLQTSTTALADYMRDQFGVRPVPWLSTEEEDLEVSIDFDGSITGIVSAPAEDPLRGFGAPATHAALPRSPIMRARSKAEPPLPRATATASGSMPPLRADATPFPTRASTPPPFPAFRRDATPVPTRAPVVRADGTPSRPTTVPPVPPSARRDATPAPSVARRDATPAPSGARRDATPAPSVVRRDATPAPSIARGDATPAPSVVRRDATPAPSGARRDATPIPRVATPRPGSVPPVPPLVRGDATPIPRAATPRPGSVPPVPPLVRGDATPVPSRGDATPVPSRGDATPAPSVAREDAAPAMRALPLRADATPVPSPMRGMDPTPPPVPGSRPPPMRGPARAGSISSSNGVVAGVDIHATTAPLRGLDAPVGSPAAAEAAKQAAARPPQHDTDDPFGEAPTAFAPPRSGTINSSSVRRSDSSDAMRIVAGVDIHAKTAPLPPPLIAGPISAGFEVEEPPPRRRRWLFAAIGAAAIGGGIVLALALGGGGGRKGAHPAAAGASPPAAEVEPARPAGAAPVPAAPAPAPASTAPPQTTPSEPATPAPTTDSAAAKTPEPARTEPARTEPARTEPALDKRPAKPRPPARKPPKGVWDPKALLPPK